MDGYNQLIVISGIDGDFKEFTSFIEPDINFKDCIKIQYDRSIKFVQNIKNIKKIIDNIEKKCYIIGWSIGAVAAAFLASCENVDIVFMINPFYKRSELLSRRNIFCDEEIDIGTTTPQPVKYIIISGIQDDKIPYQESLKIAKYYNLAFENLHLIENAKHNLVSFPVGKIADIINRNLL